MTNPEQMRPHELAEQILQSDYEIVAGRVESERLNGLIDRSQTVWQQLARGKFEENEFGHATFGIEDWVGDYMTPSGDHVDALRVYFHDPHGSVVLLGSVSRTGSYSGKATASVFTGEGKREPLLPNDPRWNAVVGVVERAIETCQKQKRERTEGAE